MDEHQKVKFIQDLLQEVLLTLPATLIAVDKSHTLLFVGGEIVRSVEAPSELLAQLCGFRL